MRRARFTYEGAYHHVMNRGIKGENIFHDDISKKYFLETMREKSKKLRIKIFTYCIMDNHYHLILQNTSGRMSDFIKQLNGQYGIYYRKKEGGKGYVFQSRYKSTLIQEDRYLSISIIYVLLNPVRVGIVKDTYEYKWISIKEYFKKVNSKIVDNEFVERLYENKKGMKEMLKEWSGKDISIQKTRFGEIMGDENFIEKAIEKFDRREEKGKSRRMRKEDYVFEPVEKIIKRFEREKEIKIEKIDVNTRLGKELRSELLVLMKDEAGLRYREIIEYKPFQSLKYSSLGALYKRAKSKRRGE